MSPVPAPHTSEWAVGGCLKISGTSFALVILDPEKTSHTSSVDRRGLAPQLYGEDG